MENEQVTKLVATEIAKAKTRSKPRIAIVRALFRNNLTEKMESAARKHASLLGAEVVETRLVRGTLELPLVAKALMEKKEIDGVAVLGAVIKGETKHDEAVVQNATHGLVKISLETGKPAGIGIIGPGVTSVQAEARAEEYSKGAVEAVVLSHQSLAEVK